MARKVSLINMKGGVGKSTVTVNLAWHFAAYRNWLKKILVIDLDPQFNASQYLLGVRQYENLINSRRPTMWMCLNKVQEHLLVKYLVSIQMMLSLTYKGFEEEVVLI